MRFYHPWAINARARLISPHLTLSHWDLPGGADGVQTLPSKTVMGPGKRMAHRTFQKGGRIVLDRTHDPGRDQSRGGGGADCFSAVGKLSGPEESRLQASRDTCTSSGGQAPSGQNPYVHPGYGLLAKPGATALGAGDVRPAACRRGIAQRAAPSVEAAGLAGPPPRQETAAPGSVALHPLGHQGRPVEQNPRLPWRRCQSRLGRGTLALQREEARQHLRQWTPDGSGIPARVCASVASEGSRLRLVTMAADVGGRAGS